MRGRVGPGARVRLLPPAEQGLVQGAPGWHAANYSGGASDCAAGHARGRGRRTISAEGGRVNSGPKIVMVPAVYAPGGGGLGMLQARVSHSVLKSNNLKLSAKSCIK